MTLQLPRMRYRAGPSKFALLCSTTKGIVSNEECIAYNLNVLSCVVPSNELDQ